MYDLIFFLNETFPRASNTNHIPVAPSEHMVYYSINKNFQNDDMCRYNK